MFRNLFETARKHLLVKLSLGLVLVLAASAGVEQAYRSGILHTTREGDVEQLARRLSRNLGVVVARPLFDGNRGAVDDALQVLGEGVAGSLVIDADGHDVAAAGDRHFSPDETVIASHGVDYEDAQGNRIPVGAVVVALPRPGAGPWWDDEGAAVAARSAATALLALAALLVFTRRVGPSLRDIYAALDKLERGETDFRLSGIERSDELGSLSSAVRSLGDAIRSRQQAVERLRASLAEKELMLERVPVGILAERGGVIVACNACLERIFGYPPGELVGRLCRTLYISDAAFTRVDAEARQTCQQGKAYAGEVELRRKDGKVFWGALSAAASPGIDTSACNIWVYSDISDAKHAAADMLERRLRLEKLVAERTSQLEEARQKAAGVGISTDAVWDHSSPGVGHPADAGSEMLPFDPAGMLEGVAALLAPMAEAKGLELVLEIDAGLPPSLLGDPFRIGQVLTNLLSNAIRFAKQGDIVVGVRKAGRDRDRLQLEFRVRDQGIGVLREQQGDTFSPGGDTAGDTSAVRRAAGRKLGLAISKRLVESMGGALEVESKLGQGNTFHFTADFEIVDQARDKANSYVERLRANAGRHVMLIDDNRSARLAVATLLSTLGFVPVLFESGWTALASLVRTGAPDYLFICIDRRMPELDGLEVARRLHAHYGGTCPPLFLLSAFSHSAELQGAEHGFATVVSKPITIDRLFSHIAAVLGVTEADPATKLTPHLKGKRILLVQKDGMHQEIVADFLRAAGLLVRIAREDLQALQAVREDAPDCVLVDCTMPNVDVCKIIARLRVLGYTRLPIIGLSAGALAADTASLLAAGMSECLATPLNLPALLGILARWMAPPILHAATADGGALPPLPPELDVETGLRHLRGKTALFIKALRMFRDNCGRQFQLEFHTAVTAGDWQTSERLAHGLKGSAATIGANQVSAAAARLEAAIRASNYAEAAALLAELTEKLQILVQGLAHIG